jgi:hypothetical protein
MRLRAMDVGDIAQVKHNPVGNRSDLTAGVSNQIANFLLKDLRIFSL